jgi:hypothetical protein
VPRIRTVKPAYPKNRKVRSVSRDARLLNIHLWNLADDEGRLQELIQTIIGEVFPTDDDVNPGVVHGWLRELSGAGLIQRYEVDGEAYIQCHDFNDHQRIEKPRPSELPPPPEAEPDPLPDGSGSDPGAIPDDSRPEEEREEEKEGEGDVPAGGHAAAGPTPISPFAPIVQRLDSVAVARNVASPKVDAALAVCAEYGHLDLAALVEEFGHYYVDGPGTKRSFDDVVWKWRNWLKHEKERRGRERPASPRDDAGDDATRLLAEAARLRAEEARA